MKENVKGFRNKFRSFKAAAKNVPCDVKLPLYWKLVEECMEKDGENAIFVRDRCREFTYLRTMELRKKLGIK